MQVIWVPIQEFANDACVFFILFLVFLEMIIPCYNCIQGCQPRDIFNLEIVTMSTKKEQKINPLLDLKSGHSDFYPGENVIGFKFNFQFYSNFIWEIWHWYLETGRFGPKSVVAQIIWECWQPCNCVCIFLNTHAFVSLFQSANLAIELEKWEEVCWIFPINVDCYSM